MQSINVSPGFIAAALSICRSTLTDNDDNMNKHLAELPKLTLTV